MKISECSGKMIYDYKSQSEFSLSLTPTQHTQLGKANLTDAQMAHQWLGVSRQYNYNFSALHKTHLFHSPQSQEVDPGF